MHLEVPVFNLESAITAAQAGAHRLELCTDLHSGGTTPSDAFFRLAKEKTRLPVFVMIRPRGGSFIYTSTEKKQLEKELIHFKNLNADGFVFGALDDKNKIDTGFCKALIQQAGGIACTFHRAFDLVENPSEALEQLIELGFSRILTSGGAPDVSLGLAQIIKLMKQAKNRIIVMPGGGLKKVHLPDLQKTGYLKEIHAGCKIYLPTEICYTNGAAAFFGNQTGVDEGCVRSFLKF